jgi:hypothetical protein
MGVFEVFQLPIPRWNASTNKPYRRRAGRGRHHHSRRRRKGRAFRGEAAGIQWQGWQQAQLNDLLERNEPDGVHAALSHPKFDTTIIGTINPAHLHAKLDALKKGPSPPDLYAEAQTRLAAAGSVLREVWSGVTMQAGRP